MLQPVTATVNALAVCRISPSSSFSTAIIRHDMLSLRPTEWLNDGVINEFVCPLNLRQRRLEDEGFSVPGVLYMGCFFYTKLTTDTRASSLDRLRQVAGCDRCFLQQDLVVLPIHVGNCQSVDPTEVRLLPSIWLAVRSFRMCLYIILFLYNLPAGVLSMLLSMEQQAHMHQKCQGVKATY